MGYKDFSWARKRTDAMATHLELDEQQTVFIKALQASKIDEKTKKMYIAEYSTAHGDKACAQLVVFLDSVKEKLQGAGKLGSQIDSINEAAKNNDRDTTVASSKRQRR
jgi:hypothetical protein